MCLVWKAGRPRKNWQNQGESLYRDHGWKMKKMKKKKRQWTQKDVGEDDFGSGADGVA
jgi:hypothetical protein